MCLQAPSLMRGTTLVSMILMSMTEVSHDTLSAHITQTYNSTCALPVSQFSVMLRRGYHAVRYLLFVVRVCSQWRVSRGTRGVSTAEDTGPF